jgi:hypothetical protein
MIREIEVSVAKLRYEDFLCEAEHQRLINRLPKQPVWWQVALPQGWQRLRQWLMHQPAETQLEVQPVAQTQV